jgi:rubredoxin
LLWHFSLAPSDDIPLLVLGVVLGGLVMKTWVCTVCGWIYDEAQGDSEYDLAPGVAFADLPEDFVCPLCGVGKDMFEEQ